MPRTELLSKQADGSPNWVDWNDKWMSGVRFEVKKAVVFETTVSSSGSAREAVQRYDAANDDRQRVALWGEVITAWSFSDQGIPVPSQNLAGPSVIWSVLDGPDFNALASATQGLFDEVTAVPTSPASAKASSAT